MTWQTLMDRYRRRFPPRRRVLDSASPILRWDRGQAVTAFMARLECGHLLDQDRRGRKRRPCFKCARGLPPDSRTEPRHHLCPGCGSLTGRPPGERCLRCQGRVCPAKGKAWRCGRAKLPEDPTCGLPRCEAWHRRRELLPRAQVLRIQGRS